MPFSEDLDAFLDSNEHATYATVGGELVLGILDRDFVEVLGAASNRPTFLTKSTAQVRKGDSLYIEGTQYKAQIIEDDGTGMQLLGLELQPSPAGDAVAFTFNQGFIEGEDDYKQNDHDITHAPDSAGVYHLHTIKTTPISTTGSDVFGHYTSPDCRNWTPAADVTIGTGINLNWRAQVWAPFIFPNPNYGVGGAPQTTYKWLMLFAAVDSSANPIGTTLQKIGLAGCLNDANLDAGTWAILNSDAPIYWAGMDDTVNGGSYAGGAPWADYSVDWAHASRDPHNYEDGGNQYLTVSARSAASVAYTCIGRARFTGGATPDFTSVVHEATPILTATTSGDWVFESTSLYKVGSLWHLFGKGTNGTRHQSAAAPTGPWGTTSTSGTVLMSQGGYPIEGTSYGEAAELLQYAGTGDIWVMSGFMKDVGEDVYMHCFVELDFSAATSPGDTPTVRPMVGPIGLAGLQAGAVDLTLRWSIGDSEGSSGAFYYQPVWHDQSAKAGGDPSGMTLNSYIATRYKHYVPGADEEGNSWPDWSRVGWIRSTSWTVTRDRMVVMVAGARLANEEFIALVRASDGKVLFKETGNGSQVLTSRVWDSSQVMGMEVFLVVADLSTATGSTIAIDEFREYAKESDEPDEVAPKLPALVDQQDIDDLIGEEVVA